MTNLLTQMQVDKERKMKHKNKDIKRKIKKALRERLHQEGLGPKGDDESELNSKYDGIYDSEEDSSGEDGEDI